MIGLYDAVATRLGEGGQCPAVLRVETGMSPDSVEVFAMSYQVTALVHPLSDEADLIREGASLVSQRVSYVFGVTMALAYPAGFAEFEPARAQIVAALRGWLAPGLTTPDLATPLEYAGGRTLQYDVSKNGGLWLHLLRFRTTTRETYEHQP